MGPRRLLRKCSVLHGSHAVRLYLCDDVAFVAQPKVRGKSLATLDTMDDRQLVFVRSFKLDASTSVARTCGGEKQTKQTT